MNTFLLFLLSSTAAFAGGVRDGGNSGGGGNLNVEDPVSQSEIYWYLTPQKSKTEGVANQVQFFFNHAAPRGPQEAAAPRFDHYQSTDPTSDRMYVKLGEMLFGQGYPIFAALKQANWVIDRHPCIDPNTGKENDASADIRTHEICFNTKRIAAQNLSRLGYRKLLLALAAHEASHLLGANEAEANFVQNVALEANVPSQLDMPFWSKSFDVEKEITLLIRGMGTMSSNKLCLRAMDITRTVGKLHDAVFTFDESNRMSPISPDKRVFLWSALMKSFNLPSFCAGTPIGPDAEWKDIAPVFHEGEPSVSLAEFKKRYLDGVDFGVTDGIVRNLRNADRDRFQAELTEIRDLALQAVPNDVNSHCVPGGDRFSNCFGNL